GPPRALRLACLSLVPLTNVFFAPALRAVRLAPLAFDARTPDARERSVRSARGALPRAAVVDREAVRLLAALAIPGRAIVPVHRDGFCSQPRSAHSPIPAGAIPQTLADAAQAPPPH